MHTHAHQRTRAHEARCTPRTLLGGMTSNLESLRNHQPPAAQLKAV